MAVKVKHALKVQHSCFEADVQDYHGNIRVYIVFPFVLVITAMWTLSLLKNFCVLTDIGSLVLSEKFDKTGLSTNGVRLGPRRVGGDGRNETIKNK